MTASRHPSPADRAAAGKAVRAAVSRSTHGDWEPAADRADPIALLEAQATSRVGELIPLRYARMLASPFAFYRGAAAVMSADLASTPQSGIRVQLCGDAHLSNFGGYASPDREMVFDLNDFDETLPGPWEWDVKRLAASIAVAGRELGFSRRQRRRAVTNAVSGYRESMRRLAKLSNLEVWYIRLDVDEILRRWSTHVTSKQLASVQRNLEKARSKDRTRALSKLTEKRDGELRIVNRPPLIVPFEELAPEEQRGGLKDRVMGALENYRATLSEDRARLFDSYRYVHAALKVVGVGSVGSRAWIVLMLGRDERDPLFLQVKEAQASVLEPHLEASRYAHHGERVVQGQKLTQAASDIFLGWMTAKGFDGEDRDYYVRQLWDWKGSAQVELMGPGRLALYGLVCGTALARAHARAGDRIAIASYLGGGDKFDEAVAEFAEAYADQNQRDFEALRKAADDGRIEVASEDPK